MSNKYGSGGVSGDLPLDNGMGVELGKARYGNAGFDEGKIKRADDGRFGTTSSGKAVHDHAGHDAHKDFTPEEHSEASSMHFAAAKKHKAEKHGDGASFPRANEHSSAMAKYHREQASAHGVASDMGGSFDDVKAEAAASKKPDGAAAKAEADAYQKRVGTAAAPRKRSVGPGL